MNFRRTSSLCVTASHNQLILRKSQLRISLELIFERMRLKIEAGCRIRRRDQDMLRFEGGIGDRIDTDDHKLAQVTSHMTSETLGDFYFL